MPRARIVHDHPFPCCVMSVLENLLFFANAILTAAGILTMFVAASLFHKFHHLEYMLSKGLILGQLGVGFFLTFISVLGCFGALNMNGPMLGFYAVIIVLLIATQAVMSIAILEFTGDLGGQNLAPAIQDAIECVYDSCCLNEHLNKTSCKFDDVLCHELPKIFLNLCNTTSSFEEYSREISAWAHDNIYPSSIILVTVGIIELIGALCACSLSCWIPEHAEGCTNDLYSEQEEEQGLYDVHNTGEPLLG